MSGRAGGSSAAAGKVSTGGAGTKRARSSERRFAYFQFSSREVGSPLAARASRARRRPTAAAWPPPRSTCALLANSWAMRSVSALMGSRRSRRLAGDEVITPPLELEGERAVAAAGDAAADQHVYVVRHDVLEQPLIVRHQHTGAVRRALRVHTRGDHLESIDVESGVGLIEDCKPWLEHQHLQDLVALLLAAGEAFIDGAREEAVLHVHELHLLAHQCEEIERVHLGQPLNLAHRVDGRLEEVDVVDARDFHRVLKAEKQPEPCALLGRECEQVLPEVM